MPFSATFFITDPLRTFELKQVAFVYGSRYKQRYFTKIGDDYFVLPAQWDVDKKRWLPYHVEMGTDWWSSVYSGKQHRTPDRSVVRRFATRSTTTSIRIR